MRDLDNAGSITPSDYGFNLAFGLSGKILDISYGKFLVSTVKYDYTFSGG